MSKGGRVKESEARSWSPGRLGFFLAEARRAKSYSLAASGGWAHGLQRRLSKESRGECLKLSQQSADSVLKATWLRLADAWQKLACECEKRKAKKD
jgi:hypothetical protein